MGKKESMRLAHRNDNPHVPVDCTLLLLLSTGLDAYVCIFFHHSVSGCAAFASPYAEWHSGDGRKKLRSLMWTRVAALYGSAQRPNLSQANPMYTLPLLLAGPLFSLPLSLPISVHSYFQTTLFIFTAFSCF